MDLKKHLFRQIGFSFTTFGPNARLNGVLDHISKEIEEIKQQPNDLEEWVDLIILAFDGAWRAGYSPDEIATAIEAKQTKNEGRSWPDWRTMSEDEAIEHHRVA